MRKGFLLLAAACALATWSAAGPAQENAAARKPFADAQAKPIDQTQGKPFEHTHGRPKLVVMLIVDQMRSDYVATYGRQWTRGLRRLFDQGAWFENAAYPYLNTVTCAGHATISTGRFPSSHGMILNAWWDRQEKRSVSCTDDPNSPLVSYGKPLTGGASAKHLQAPTFSELLRKRPRATRGRVVSFSIKARSAVMLAGKSANLAVWFEGPAGAWATSAAYAGFPSQFLKKFFAAHPIERLYGKAWARLLPESAYLNADDAPGENPPVPGWTAAFPHVLHGGSGKADAMFYNAWRMSPFADDYLGEMARAAVDVMKLGRRRGTDLLAISFSALDIVGHQFGPRSHEVQDVLARLDVTIGALLEHLDRRVGAGNYVVALTADHGVASVPEQLAAEGAEAGRIGLADLEQRVRAALNKHMNLEKNALRPLYTDLYFSRDLSAALEANPEALGAVMDALREMPGIWNVFRGEELPGRKASPDLVERAAALSYFPGRSGDLILVPRPNWFFVPGSSSNGDAVTHGTAHWYDARVPLLFYGFGVRPGRYAEAATPADIAPTLARLCGLEMPGTEGRVLGEALAQPQ